MVDWLAYAIIAGSLLLAAWCGFSAYREHPMYVPHLVGLGVLQLGLLGQVAVSVVLLAGGDRPEGSLAVFLSYLVSVALIPLAAAGWGLVERSKWGPAVIAFACLVVPALMVRLQDLWWGA